MPYIICTNMPGYLSEADPVAVATIEEARDEAAKAVDTAIPDVPLVQPGEGEDDRTFRYWQLMHDCDELPETGGTIGPLPDGYVIDVQPVSRRDLVAAAGLVGPSWRGASLADIVSAYNEPRRRNERW